MSRRLVLNVGLAGIYLVWADERSWLGVLVGIAIGFGAQTLVRDIVSGTDLEEIVRSADWQGDIDDHDRTMDQRIWCDRP